MNALIFDIETGPRSIAELLPLMPEFSAPSNFKDEVKIAEAIASKRKAWLDDAALDAMTGKILAIGLQSDDRPTVLHGNGDEATMLTQFWNHLDERYHHASREDLQIIGYNIASFDLPFLLRRSWHHGVKPPAWIRRGRYWHESFVDLRECWQCGDRQASTGGLDGLAKFFGLGGKTGSGAHFAQLWETDRDAATAYLVNDLKLTALLAKKLGVI